MQPSDIAHHRLHNQHISRQPLKTPGEVVGWLGAMQAQDYTGAKRSIGLRLPNATDADVEAAIVDKTIVRTWPLRGTLHFVTAADIRWLLALTAPRMIAGNARRYRELALDDVTLVRSNDLLTNAVRNGEHLTRTELLVMLQQNGVSTQGQRAPYLLQRASLDGLIVQGISQKNDSTYFALDLLPQTRPLERDEALAELVKRYFTSRGPATLQDFIGWSGLVTADARAGVDAVQSQFVREEYDGQTYWLPASNPGRRPKSPTLYLLPGFDEYMLGYRDRRAILDPQHADKIVPGGNGVFKPTIVIDGQIVGTWKRTIKKGVVIVTPEPFTALTDAETQAFAAAAQRYGDYLEMSLSLS